MSEIEVKTAKLIGPALDWVVAQVEGVAYDRSYLSMTLINPQGAEYLSISNYRPSTDWSHGGHLRDKYKIAVYDTDSCVAASMRGNCPAHWIDENEFDADATGETALIAICRAIVATVIGETVMVPSWLMQSEQSE